jgi:hypothetical protein
MSEVVPASSINRYLTFPDVMGNEEETFMQIKFANKWKTPYDLTRNLEKYLPDDVPYAGNISFFLANGGKIYVGGVLQDPSGFFSSSNDNIERTTPECSSPKEAAIYIDAHEQLIRDIAQKYTTKIAKANQRPTTIVIHRRVVDSVGNRRGSHDNFAIDEPALYEKWPKYKAALVGYLATRSFIVGAGHVAEDGYRYAQKIDGLKEIIGYGYEGYMFRPIQQVGGTYRDSTGDRLEIRCSDINISPWAVQMRIGTAALLLTATQTELVAKITNNMLFMHNDPIAYAKLANRLNFRKSGKIKTSRPLYEAVDFQDRLADIYLGELEQYIDMPDEYYKIASELKRYCDDYRKVLLGELALSDLADRADFAAKFTKLQADIETQREFGMSPSVEFAKKIDLKYDYIAITAQPDGRVSSQVGFGHRLKLKGNFKMPITDADVRKAYHYPPQGTRAVIRGNAIRNYNVEYVDWNGFEFVSPGVKIRTDNPLQTMLSDSDVKAMDIHRR